MRRAYMLFAMTLALVALSVAVASGSDVVKRIEREVSREIDMGTSTTPNTGATAATFDPIARGRSHLREWTTIPEAATFRSRSVADPARLSTAAELSAPVSANMAWERYANLGATIGFPAGIETAQAIRRIASGRVSSDPHY